MKKLIIIPAYNEEKNIINVLKDIRQNAPDFDYIVINDASTDNTKKICLNNGIHFIDLAGNLGIGGAVQTGYLYAFRKGYDLAVQFDGDGQHSASSLPDMEKPFYNDCPPDMIIGSRFINREGFQSTGLRRFAIHYFTWLIKLLTGKTITDPTSGLRMCSKKVISIFADNYPWDYPEPESTTQLIKLGMDVREIPVVMKERQGGKSSISSPLKAVFYMIKVTMGIIIEATVKRKPED